MAIILAGLMLAMQVSTDTEPLEVVGVLEEDETAEAAVSDPPPPPLTPQRYLYASYPHMARRLDCMIRLESTWRPSAVSPGGTYVGLAQFDLPTWRSTPTGRAGASRYDPYASIDAMAWGVVHLGYGRWPVTSRRC